MEDYKYSSIEEIIKNNSHLKNEELAKKVGKSISWVKAFKAFMRAKDKEKYKDTKNPIYKAIYNIWIKDPKAQKKENEKNQLRKCKNELRKCKKLSAITEEELTDYKTKYQEIKTKYEYLSENFEKELKKEKEKLEKEFDEKYTPVINEFYKKKREVEEERLNYEGARLEYIKKEREFKKIVKVLTIIIFVEFLLLLFTK